VPTAPLRTRTVPHHSAPATAPLPTVPLCSCSALSTTASHLHCDCLVDELWRVTPVTHRHG